ncbi:MAG: rRNA maturation RNase YbeY [Gemmatimonadetes bacterium]|nr:rRNA maturation RNase YbeY [Gemmatimonadota bacterium]MDA1102870.1 rRNA maturation RNase YbeY [Gemmatimonadota bacterium]
MGRRVGQASHGSGVEVIVNVGDFEPVEPDLMERAVRCALASALRDTAEVSLTLLPDAEMRRLNREYLYKDVSTDVIAFSLGDDTRVIGDIYIGFDQAVRQAAEYGVVLHEELARLAIHGMLHVLGHDHSDGSDRLGSPMYLLQERLLRELLDER